MIYAISGVKGGIAKSTSTLYLAEALARENRRVLVIDADPQGTLLEWEATAEASGEPLSVRVEGLPSAVLLRRKLPALAGEDYDDVLIDCPNRDTGIIEAAMSLASFVIIPCPSGVEELRRARIALQLAEQTSTRARLLLTLVDTRTSLAREVTEVIDADDTLSRFTTMIRRRAAIAETVGVGRPKELCDYAELAKEIMEMKEEK
jgi:chromosome partitioning protein